MQVLKFDTETRSPVPIKDGTWAYAAQADILIASFQVGENPVGVWGRAEGTPMPEELAFALADTTVEIWAHNAAFDRAVMLHSKDALLRRAAEDLGRWHCSMALAYAHSLPGSLEALGETLAVAQDARKSKRGRELMRLFCIPPAKNAKRDWATPLSHPQEWAEFKEYAGQDIVAMGAVMRKVPRWNYKGAELALWRLDQKINARGVAIDMPLMHAAIRASDAAQTTLAEQVADLTNGEVSSATRRDALLAHILAAYGVSLPDMRADTLERRLNDPELPQGVRDLIAVRLQASMNSVAKYKVFLRGVSADGRMRGTKQFCGAGRTGRWAGRLVQLDNMPRPTLPQDELDMGINAMKVGAEGLIFDNVMTLCSSAIRGCLIASPGRKLVVADLSNIEGRVAAWLAGEEWKLQAFSNYDTFLLDANGNKIPAKKKGEFLREGPDLYVLAYTRAFNVSGESVTKEQRQIGKVCIAEGQLVLTSRGLVPIQEVTRDMLVWDGVAWVRHQGVICQGTKEVITYDGLTATPDHKVWINGSAEPVPFMQAAASGQRLLESGADRNPLRVMAINVPDSTLHPRVEWPVCARPMHWVRAGVVASICELITRVKFVVQRMRTGTPDTAMVVAALRRGEAALHQSARSRVGRLRGAWDTLRVRVGNPRGALHDRAVWVAATRDGNRPAGQRGGLHPRQPEMGHRATEPSQHSAVQVSGVEPERMALRKECNISQTETRHDAGRCAERRVASGGREAQKLEGHPRKVRVYDLVNAGPRHRFTVSGKLVANCELMLSYGGGVNAFLTGAATYGIDLDAMTEAVHPTLPVDVIGEAESFLTWLYEKAADTPAAKLKARHGLNEKTFIACDSLKRLWRRAHPAISSFWKELEGAFRTAMYSPGVTIVCRRLKFRRDGNWLRIGLPSGRAMCFLDPKIADDGSLSYAGVNPYTRQWGRVYTYGGKLLEGPTQSVARDQLAYPMQLIEDAGYAIVAHVHDEVICEVPDADEFTHERLAELMCARFPWNEGLPLAAAGFTSYRYRKD